MTLLDRRIALASMAAVVAVVATRLEAKAMLVPDDVRAAIEAVLADQAAAWNRGDATAFAAHTTDDVVFTNVVGMFSVGRAPFVAQHARIFATMYKGSTMRQAIEHIALVRPDVAIVDTLTSVSDVVAAPAGAEAVDGVFHARLEQVMVRDRGHWSVASFHNVLVNAKAVAAAAR